MSRQDHPAGPPEQRFHASKVKMGLLIVPCLLGAGAALQTDGVEGMAAADFELINAAALAICLLVALLLLRMMLEKEPVIVINAAGIHCRRPPVGTIPWSAIIGIGAGRATLMRRVLMIAVDPNQLDPQGREHVRNSVGALSLLSPQLSKFKRLAQGHPSINIPISLLSTPPSRIEAIVQDFVTYHITDKEA